MTDTAVIARPVIVQKEQVLNGSRSCGGVRACVHADWATFVSSWLLDFFDHDRTLFEAGLHASVVNKGFNGNVLHFDGRGFQLSLPCGDLRSIQFGDDLTPDKLQQWKFVLRKCYSASVPLRVLGAT